MQPSLKVNSDLSSLGMSKPHLKLQRNGDAPTLSPKELWQKKEKELKIKGLILLIVTQLFWVMILFSEDQVAPLQTTQTKVEEGHELIKLPATIYSQVPREGKKIAVTLFQKGSSKTIAAFLRGFDEDPIGDSGVKAILEVPQNQLHFIKSNTRSWQVFPPMMKQVQKQRSIYEINF